MWLLAYCEEMGDGGSFEIVARSSEAGLRKRLGRFSMREISFVVSINEEAHSGRSFGTHVHVKLEN